MKAINIIPMIFLSVILPGSEKRNFLPEQETLVDMFLAVQKKSMGRRTGVTILESGRKKGKDFWSFVEL